MARAHPWAANWHEGSDEPKAPHKHLGLRGLLSLYRAALELVSHPSDNLVASIRRKLLALNLTSCLPLLPRPKELADKIAEGLARIMKNHYRSCLKRWKTAARSWKLFSYV